MSYTTMTALLRLAAMATLLLCGAVPGVEASGAPGPTMPNIDPNCNKWYVAKDGDNCRAAAAAGGISLVKFYQFNPDVSKDCTQNFFPTYAYCIGVGVAISSPSTSMSAVSTTSKSSITTKVSSSTVPPTTTTNATYSIRNPIMSWNITTSQPETTFPPRATQPGQPSYCIDWHLVSIGDTCEGIFNRYFTSLTMDDFLDWNPELLDDCSGLQIGYWLCIRTQPRSSLTLTYGTLSTSVIIPDKTTFIPPTLPVIDSNFTPSPTPGSLPGDCQDYYLAQSGDRCDNVLASYPAITREQFFSWNPFLNGNCDGLWLGYYYCVWAGSMENRPGISVATTKPNPVPSGTVNNCLAWYLTSGGDSCELIVEIFGRFSYQDFIAWNPAVKSDCSNIQDDVYYCVSIPGVATTRTKPYPSTIPGDTESTTSPISTTTSPATTLPTGTITKPSTTTTSIISSINTPTPTQPDMIAGCRRFYLTRDGDGCWAIANAANIDLNDFYKWNPSVKSDCSEMWLKAYVCIGIAGATTTISQGPPVPT